MVIRQWLAPSLLAGATAVVSTIAHAQTARAPSLREALDAAWDRAVAAQEARGEERVATASQAAASAWTPHAPSVEIARRDGRSGFNETELALAVPLWVPGQRSLVAAKAAADLEVARAARESARWRLAGELRDSAWTAHAHEAEAVAAREQLRLLRALSADVARRVDAGDLARVDALVARAEVLAAEASVAELQQRFELGLARWQLLTGLSALPDASESTSEGSTAPETPEITLARLQVQRSERHVEAMRVSRREPPEVALSWRQERPGSAEPRQDSVGVALRVPFGTDARNVAQEARALAELETARVHLQRLTEGHALDVRSAREALRTAERQLASEESRSSLLRERAQLLDRSFQAGETGLPDLLRALAGAAQAEGALARQRAALGLARARLRHTLGWMP